MSDAQDWPAPWSRRCLPLTPCESRLCGRMACKGLGRAKATVRRRENRRYNLMRKQAL